MKNNKNFMITKKDLRLIGVILLFAIIGLFINRYFNSQTSSFVEVHINGSVTHQFDLSSNHSFFVDNGTGGTNQLVINNGMVSITDANCPDKLCVHQGRITQTGQLITCLPNKVVVIITSKE